MMKNLALIALAGALLSCGTAKPGGMSGPTIGRMTESKLHPLESADVLRRTKTSDPVIVQHVLIAWDDLAGNYEGRLDDAAKSRSRFDAEDLVREIVKRLEGGEAIKPLMQQYSSDSGTKRGAGLKVTADSSYLPRFVALSMRLEVKEIGVVKTGYGFHVVRRFR